MSSEGHEGVRRAGQGEGKKSPFFAAAPDAWEELAETFPKPWPRAATRLDLTHHENAFRGLGRAFPSLRQLCDRWGWTPKAVRLALAREDWHDALNPVPLADLQAGRAIPRKGSERVLDEGHEEGHGQGHTRGTAHARGFHARQP